VGGPQQTLPRGDLGAVVEHLLAAQPAGAVLDDMAVVLDGPARPAADSGGEQGLLRVLLAVSLSGGGRPPGACIFRVCPVKDGEDFLWLAGGARLHVALDVLAVSAACAVPLVREAARRT